MASPRTWPPTCLPAPTLWPADRRRAAWLGYSMGGRYALHVALRHPELVRRLVLVSATGGIDDPAERAARREGDEALADRSTPTA